MFIVVAVQLMVFNSVFVGVHEKQEIKKKKNEKGPISTAHLPTVPASKPSADQIRHSVKQSLKEILMKRYEKIMKCIY